MKINSALARRPQGGWFSEHLPPNLSLSVSPSWIFVKSSFLLCVALTSKIIDFPCVFHPFWAVTGFFLGSGNSFSGLFPIGVAFQPYRCQAYKKTRNRFFCCNIFIVFLNMFYAVPRFLLKLLVIFWMSKSSGRLLKTQKNK